MVCAGICAGWGLANSQTLGYWGKTEAGRGQGGDSCNLSARVMRPDQSRLVGMIGSRGREQKEADSRDVVRPGREGTGRQQSRRPIAPSHQETVKPTPWLSQRAKGTELHLHTPTCRSRWRHSQGCSFPSTQTMGTWTKGLLRLRSLLLSKEEMQMELG